MNASDFKFTLYDVISYTFCGAISLILFHVVLVFNAITLPDTEFSEFILKLVSLDNAFFFIVVSYFVGKIISALSSIIFEKLILKGILKKFDKLRNISTHISGKLYDFFNQRYSQIFNEAAYNVNDWKILTAYVEENRPASYVTAFTYLAYYGMSRNLMLIFLATSVVLLGSDLILGIIAFIIFLIETYEYSRFLKYFHEQIIYAFLNNKEENK